MDMQLWTYSTHGIAPTNQRWTGTHPIVHLSEYWPVHISASLAIIVYGQSVGRIWATLTLKDKIFSAQDNTGCVNLHKNRVSY